METIKRTNVAASVRLAENRAVASRSSSTQGQYPGWYEIQPQTARQAELLKQLHNLPIQELLKVVLVAADSQARLESDLILFQLGRAVGCADSRKRRSIAYQKSNHVLK